MAGGGDGKRKRAVAFSDHEKYMHKSSVILQREGKKIRAFLVRKVVAQLKQTREQHSVAARACEELLKETTTDDKKRKRVEGKQKKLFYQLEKLEKELFVLKTLDLDQVVKSVFEKTGLKEDTPEKQSDDEDEDEEEDDEMMMDSDRYAHGGGGGGGEGEEDDGFKSEDYDEGPGLAESESESEGDDDDEMAGGNGDGDDQEEATAEEAEEATAVVSHEAQVQQEATNEVHDEPTAETKKAGEPASTADATLVAHLVDRVLTHNQMKPLVDAIRHYVEKKERDDAKKKRLKEKKALKRIQASLIGGRSASAPTSMFFGSLSSSKAAAEDEAFNNGSLAAAAAGGRSHYGPSSSMAGADGDIAEFLGETKKKKNRAGQMARRQKAIRMEEALQRAGPGGATEGAGGFQKRRFHERDPQQSASKYGPSERPKKQQKPVSSGRPAPRDGGGDRSRPTGRSSRPEDRARGDNATTTAAPGALSRRPLPPSTAAPRAAPTPPQRKAEAAPSHPSWLAKQAMKDKEKVSIHAFAGKKMTFGDD